MNDPVAHVFVVTGASGGLGQAIVQALSRRASAQNEQRHIVLVGRNRRALEAASGRAVSSSTRTYLVSDLDLGQPAVTERVMAKLREVAEPLTNPRLTLVHCAGTLGDLSKTVDCYEEHDIAAYVAVNFTSFCALTSRFLAFARAQDAPRVCVVNISSLLAVQASANWGLYAAIKAARDQLLAVVAVENTSDCRVKTLSYAPGPLDNDMQREVRESIGDPAQQQLYAGLHAEGKLVVLDDTATVLCELLDKWEFASGAHIDIYDVL
ncbi:hypothetical protein IWW50_001235 [Coemansia erecta]|nr:hypothetical protein GGF43_001086 [Coemansia sp. RSA 2618]KAJ2828726.1 hypothetical protein IWW50_001235 [Coemansia erecta]